MKTIQLRFKEEAYSKIIDALKQIEGADLEVFYDENYQENKKYLEKALQGIEDGTNGFISLEEFSEEMDEIISGYENSNQGIV